MRPGDLSPSGDHPPVGAGGVSASGAETDDNTRYHSIGEGNEIGAPTWELQVGVPAIDRLAYSARGLASFASYTLALFSQNEIVAAS
jgi:hypothetical protein